MSEEVETNDSFDERAARLEERIARIEATANARLVAVELKSEALRAGMIDLDGLKLLDASALKPGPSGEVEGASELISKLRRVKPWLFGGASSSSPAVAPPSQAPAAKSAREMSYPEWQIARAALLRRR